MSRTKRDGRTTSHETLRLAKGGDKAAIAAVVFEVDALGRWWAGKYGRGNSALTEDLHSIARVAVFDAIRTYQPGKGPWMSWVTQWMKARMWSSFNLKHHTREVRGLDADDAASAEPADEQLAAEAQRRELHRAVAKLPTYLRTVMHGRLEGKTLAAIGRDVDRSRERVRQLEAVALERLRRAMEAA